MFLLFLQWSILDLAILTSLTLSATFSKVSSSSTQENLWFFPYVPVYILSPSIIEFLVIHLFLLLECKLLEIFETRD